jgi:hypothetical protein
MLYMTLIKFERLPPNATMELHQYRNFLLGLADLHGALLGLPAETLPRGYFVFPKKDELIRHLHKAFPAHKKVYYTAFTGMHLRNDESHNQ